MIISSQCAREHAQADGSFWVEETHTCDDGEPMVFRYLAEPGLDFNAVTAKRAAEINANMAAQAAAVEQ